jgi:hypothetical protein
MGNAVKEAGFNVIARCRGGVCSSQAAYMDALSL